jgi:hypothetical protein
VSKVYVIAGTATEARNWIDSNIRKRHASGNTSVSLSDYVTITSAITLRGIVDPHGVFVGSWKDRLDIEEIVEALFMCSHAVNRDLEKIRNDVRALNRVKPTPKIQGLRATSISIGELAEQLSNEIDNHVIQEMRKKYAGNLPTP